MELKNVRREQSNVGAEGDVYWTKTYTEIKIDLANLSTVLRDR